MSPVQNIFSLLLERDEDKRVREQNWSSCEAGHASALGDVSDMLLLHPSKPRDALRHLHIAITATKFAKQSRWHWR
jgi:hypothetical protein